MWERALAPLKKECVCRSGVKEEFVDAFFKYGLLLDDPCLKCYFFCNAFKFQLIDSAGQINTKLVGDNFDYLDYPLVQKCTNVTEPDLCEKVYQAVKCIDNDLSERFPEKKNCLY